MTVTVIGAFILPAGLVCTLFRPAYLLPLLVISSIFQAGSVVNGMIGSFAFGVPPFYFVAACIAIRYLFLPRGQTKIFATRTDKIVTLLVAFWVFSLASSFILPRVFAGIPVYSPREGIDEQFLYQTPLIWSLSNLSQGLFLTLDIIVILYALNVVRTEKQADQLQKDFYIAALIVAAVGLCQYIALRQQWSFPYEIFDSNPVYSQGSEEVLGDWQRVSSTFTEPSAAGAFLAAAGSGLLAAFLRGRRSLLHFLAIMVVLAVLLETTSTTGLVAFSITVSLLLVFFNPLARKKVSGQSYAWGWVAIFACVVPAGILLLINPSLLEAVSMTTLDKSEGLSFLHRIAADGHALGLAWDTYGLGVGLGSNRPSSLLTALLSTVGVLGTLLFIAMLYHILKAFRGRGEAPALQMSFWALIALMIGAFVAGPDLTSPVLWTVLTLVLVQLNTKFIGRVDATNGSARLRAVQPPAGRVA
jgi:hypothetical protein